MMQINSQKNESSIAHKETIGSLKTAGGNQTGINPFSGYLYAASHTCNFAASFAACPRALAWISSALYNAGDVP